MALEGFYVNEVKRTDITDFIESNHYSGSINGCISDYCYALYSPNNKMVGALFFGRMAMAGQWKRFTKYGAKNEQDVIELRRLCCVDDTPRNAESFFISRCLKLLKRQWEGRVVISYSDLHYGHEGIVYKASNFISDGVQKGGRVIVSEKGKQYHDKAIRTKYKGKLKPFAARLKKELEQGSAHYETRKGKNRYVYILRKRTTP